MHTYSKRFLRNFDFPLFFTYLFLCLFGLVMIYSASLSMRWVSISGRMTTFFEDK